MGKEEEKWEIAFENQREEIEKEKERQSKREKFVVKRQRKRRNVWKRQIKIQKVRIA